MVRPKIKGRHVTGMPRVPGVLLINLLLLLMLVAPVRAEDEVDRAAVVQAWFEARNHGDLDAAMALMTENAILVSGGCPLQTPGTGEAIPAEVARLARGNQHFTITAIQVYGSAVIGQYELSSNMIRAFGIERVVNTFITQAPEDKISAYVLFNDLTDPDAARFASRLGQALNVGMVA